MFERFYTFDTSVQVSPPVLSSIAEAIGLRMLDFHSALALRAFGERWLTTVFKENGTHICPRCANHWSTAEKRDACTHAGGKLLSDDGHRVMLHWIECAEKDR